MSEGVLIICRAVSNGISPTSTRGFHCAICKTEVQATPAGVQSIAEGDAIPLCNPCGFKVFEKIEAEKIAGVIISPEATEQMVRMMMKEAAKK